ncbi:nucleolar protein 12, partial [Clarias magur]
EFLTGFHKRKVERRKAAVEEIKNKLREEQKRVREERHKEYLKMLKERKEALEDADELDDAITSTSESVQYDHPNHTVTVTTISDLDLSDTRLLESLTNHEARRSDDEGEKGDEEEKVEALPRKAGNPLLSKKIQSLSASLHSFTKQKKKSKEDERMKRSQGALSELILLLEVDFLPPSLHKPSSRHLCWVKDESDDVSVLSAGSLCILSPDCDLYVCDGDVSQDPDEELTFDSQCEGDSSSTGSSEEEEEDLFSLPRSRMTRLDPPSHRNNPRMWMEEATSRDTFTRRSSVPH